MNDGVAICIDVDQTRIERRIEHRYLDVQADSLEDAVARASPPGTRASRCRSACWATPRTCSGPCSRVAPRRHRHRPDVGPRPAVLPAAGVAFEDWRDAAARDPRASPRTPRPRWPCTCARWWSSRTPAPRSSTTATRSATRPARAATTGRSSSRLRAAYIRPLFCEGRGPFRWAALSGDPADIAATDRAILELFPDNERLHKWITMAGERVSFQGLPARICWLGYGERHLAGLKFNEMVASGELEAPIVIGRDHLDCGSVASRTARPSRCSTAPTPSATGRSSTRWSTPRPGPHGCLSPRRRRRHGSLAARRTGLVADGTELAAQKIERC